jgi:hypothetical protein
MMKFRLHCNRDESVLPLPRNRGLPRLRIVSQRKSGKPRLAVGEGWGEGILSLTITLALTRIASQSDLSPLGRGESSLPHEAIQPKLIALYCLKMPNRPPGCGGGCG